MSQNTELFSDPSGDGDHRPYRVDGLKIQRGGRKAPPPRLRTLQAALHGLGLVAAKLGLKKTVGGAERADEFLGGFPKVCGAGERH